MLKRSAVLAFGLLVSCSAAPVAETQPPAEPAAVTTTTTTGVAAAVTAPSTVPATTITTTTTAPTEPAIRGLDLAEIVARSEGDGVHPFLLWEPVLTAATYTVLVMDGEGTPWWSWSGIETEIVLGGVQTEADIGGPARSPGVSWVVFAYDDMERLVGVSPQQSFDE